MSQLLKYSLCGNIAKTLTALCVITAVAPPGAGANTLSIDTLSSTSLENPQIREIRNDVRRAAYVIKSRKSPALLPELKFYKYRVGRDDTFWKILTGTSSNIDTLMTVNSMGSAADASPGRTIFIPNMRGIIFHNRRNTPVEHLAGAFKIPGDYILRANGGSVEGKSHIFIPLAGVSTIERSLFLGTGFITPLGEMRKTSGFGMRRDPFTRDFKFHGGIDLACRPGTRVFAARSGVVTYTGYKGGYGRTVEISHSHGYYSIYGHLSRIAVRKGSTVNTNTVIGLSGNTGRSTGPHLHFEVRRNSRPVNPYVLSRQ
jgi:murein DD-endopeptidase MepM/ murein hydrolase activator NlpD